VVSPGPDVTGRIRHIDHTERRLINNTNVGQHKEKIRTYPVFSDQSAVFAISTDRTFSSWLLSGM